MGQVIPIITTIISGTIVWLSVSFPKMFSEGFYCVYSIEHQFVEKNYLYTDAMMVHPLSYIGRDRFRFDHVNIVYRSTFKKKRCLGAFMNICNYDDYLTSKKALIIT